MPRVHYAWVIVALTFLALLASSGARTALAVFMKPIEAEFGVERAVVSLAASVGVVTGALVQPLVGQFLDRYGPRIIVSTSCVLLVGLGALASSVITAPWQLYFTYGLTAGLGGSTLATGVVARWFAQGRGMAIAICQLGLSAGQIVTAPVAVALSLSLGWRWGYALMGLVLTVGLFPLLLWRLRDEPGDLGLEPYGAAGAESATRQGGAAPGAPLSIPEGNLTAWQAFHHRDFWLLAGSYFVAGFTAGGLVGTHLVAWADDRRLPAMAAATAYGVMGVFNVPAGIATGWMTDRFSRTRLLAAVYLLRGLGLVYLLTVEDVAGLLLFSGLMGLVWVAPVPPTASLTADLAGPRSAATVFGWVFLSHQMGSALSAWLAGAVFDATGSYNGIFGLAVVLNGLAAAQALMIRESRGSRGEHRNEQLKGVVS